MEITVTNPQSPILECRVNGALDRLETQVFIDALKQAISPSTRGLILDCSAMPYMSSAGLRAIMIIGKKLMAQDARFVLCGLSGLALEIYTASGFSQVFAPVEGVDEARALFGEQA